MRQAAEPGDQQAAFATLHAALVTLSQTLAPLLPFLSEAMYRNLVVSAMPGLPESGQLTAWPAGAMAGFRDEPLERAMATARRAVELARTLRSSAGLKVRQPLARMWVALPAASSTSSARCSA